MSTPFNAPFIARQSAARNLPPFSGQFTSDAWSAVKLFGQPPVFGTVAVIPDQAYDENFTGLMQGTITGMSVGQLEVATVGIYDASDVDYSVGTAVPSVLGVGFDGTYVYAYSGSVHGTIASTGSLYPPSYRVDVYATSDIEYFMGSSQVFVADINFVTNYSYDYHGTAIGTVSPPVVGAYADYRVDVYVQTDTDYIQGSSAIDSGGTFVVPLVWTGVKNARLIRTSDEAIMGHTDAQGVNGFWLASVDAGYKLAKVVRRSDSKVLGTSNDSAPGRWSFTAPSAGYKVVKVFESGGTVPQAEWYRGAGLCRSYNIDVDDPAWGVLYKRTYCYDQAAALCAACAQGDQATAETWVGGLLKVHSENAGQFPFSVNTVSAYAPDPYYRNGAQFWCVYALAFFCSKFPASSLTATVKQALHTSFAALEQYWVSTAGYQQSNYRGGKGRYTLPSYVFDPDYQVPWTSCEHNTDAYFACKLAGQVLGAGTLTARATQIGTSLMSAYWNGTATPPRSYEGQTSGSEHDNAHALDCATWYGLAARDLGRPDIQAACVSILTDYRVYESSVAGYTAYLEKYGHTEIPANLWVEGSMGAALCRRGYGQDPLASAEYNAFRALLTPTGFPYVTQNDPENEFRDWTSLTSTAWSVLASSPNGFWYIDDIEVCSSVAPALEPSLPTAGLRAWWKADSLTLNDGDPISIWEDSFNDHNLTGGGASYPVFKTGQINGKPAVRFDLQYFHIPAGAVASLTEAEVFVVVKIDVDPPVDSQKTGLWNWGGNAVAERTHFPWIDGTVYTNFMCNPRRTTVNPTPSLASWRLYNESSASGAWTSRLDGVVLATSATNTFAPLGNFFIGRSDSDGLSSFWLVGYMAEIAFYSTRPDDTQRAQIHAYFAAKYGLTLS